MKYNVGDIVKIREDLIAEEQYGADVFTEEMKKYKGQYAQIIDIKDKDTYYLDIDKDDHWYWTDEMLEPFDICSKMFDFDDNLPMANHKDVYDALDEKTDLLTVKKLLTRTNLEKSGLIIELRHIGEDISVRIGNGNIDKNKSLYKRFLMAYGDMVVKDIEFDGDTVIINAYVYVEWGK